VRRAVVHTVIAACTFGLGAASGPDPVALAQAKIERIRVSLTNRAEDALPEGRDIIVPAGTERIYIVVDYSGAARNLIRVVVRTSGAVLVLKVDKLYSGSGTAIVEMTGAAAYRTLTGELYREADNAITNALKAQNESLGALGYLEQAEQTVPNLRGALSFVERVELPAGLIPERDSLRVAVEAMEDLVETRHREGAVDESRVRQLGKQMEDQAKIAKDVAKKLQDHGATLTSMAIPELGAERHAAYSISVSVDGSTSNSGEFWVTRGDVPSASATPQSGATSASGGSGPTATARATGGAAATASATAASSRSRPRATTAPSGSGGAATAPSGADSSPTRRPTPATGASARMTAGAAAQGGATPISAGDTAGDGDASPPGTDEADYGAEQVAPEVVPTWTVPSDAASAPDDAGGPATDADGSPDAGSGPNLAVLGIGVMALMAVAVWLRRRM